MPWNAMEYGDVEKSYGQKGNDYVKWAATMAIGLGAGVPWVMCKQTDAPENIIDASIVMVLNQIHRRSQYFGQRIGMDGTRNGVEVFLTDLLKILHLQSQDYISAEVKTITWSEIRAKMGASKGSVVGHWVKAVQPVRLVKGNNDLLLLTQTVGLQNYGAYHSDKCTTNCGKPTQTRYHVPRSWLKSPSNMLVLFEETGGNPFKISVKTVTAGILCGQISESHYPPLWKWFTPDYMNRTTLISSVAPEMHLQCENGDVISSIEFASYGTPSGSCQRLYTGKCHASKSLSIVSEACQGRNSCFIEVSNAAFGSDPCRGTLKTLAVMARCSPSQDKSYLGY